MSITMNEVRAMLAPDEPNYACASKLGADALKYIETLIKGDDPLLASKAAYLASLIQNDRSVKVLKKAMKSKYSEVRVAAAAGTRNLSPKAANELLLSLLGDKDIGVRITALKSIPANPSRPLRTKISALSAADPDSVIRTLSKQVHSKLGTAKR